MASVADRLERAIETELRAVEIRRAMLGPEPQPASEAERTTRSPATLTATLFKARRRRAAGGGRRATGRAATTAVSGCAR